MSNFQRRNKEIYPAPKIDEPLPVWRNTEYTNGKLKSILKPG